jgi:TonB-dependent SusC/RagA subfamily outer membrane receptor
VENGNIQVRGTTTFYGNQGDGALVVIDGAISTSQDLIAVSPLDIQSINVMKDGSSSVYGSRGANGVVLIETRKGK